MHYIEKLINIVFHYSTPLQFLGKLNLLIYVGTSSFYLKRITFCFFPQRDTQFKKEGSLTL